MLHLNHQIVTGKWRRPVGGAFYFGSGRARRRPAGADHGLFVVVGGVWPAGAETGVDGFFVVALATECVFVVA
jgi:hypothetical protein